MALFIGYEISARRASKLADAHSRDGDVDSARYYHTAARIDWAKADGIRLPSAVRDRLVRTAQVLTGEFYKINPYARRPISASALTYALDR